MGTTLWLQCESISFVGASAIAERKFSGSWASVVEAHGVSCPVACGIFLDRESNPVPCIGRQILNHWTTREVPYSFLCLLLVEAALFSKLGEGFLKFSPTPNTFFT